MEPEPKRRPAMLEEIARGLFVASWPVSCAGAAFETGRAEMTDRLCAVRRPFALLHDFRRVDRSVLGWGMPFLADARLVASAGWISKVAFVYGGNAAVLGTMNSLLWLSPVQPAKAFRDFDEAARWCSDDAA